MAQVIFGAGGLADFSSDDRQELYNILDSHGVRTLDTAYIYGDSEKVLGQDKAHERFTIHTKAPAMSANASSQESILAGAEKQLGLLGTDKVDVYYLHAPSDDVPIKKTLAAITQLHEEGKFERFGLSNFLPEEVQEVYDIQKGKGAVLPTVYQGLYNAVSRKYEEILFPLLRKLNIVFYAYSPIAGGFLVKSPEDFQSQESMSDRWNPDKGLLGKMYSALYNKPEFIEALTKWSKIAEEAKISKAALAFRWVTYHSILDRALGDGVIIGATKLTQLKETLTAIDAGPLPAGIAQRASEVWMLVEAVAPLDNYHDFVQKAK